MYKKLVIIFLLLCVYSLCTNPVQGKEKILNPKDSFSFYDDVVHNPSYFIQSQWIGSAIAYAQRVDNPYALWHYTYHKAALGFSQGHYEVAKKDLNRCSAAIGAVLGLRLSNPSAIRDEEKVSIPVNSTSRTAANKKLSKQDSLWRSLHLEVLNMLSRSYIFLAQYGTASLILSDMMRLYSSDTNSAVAAKCYNGIGVMMARKGLLEESFTYLNKSVKILEKSHSREDLRFLAMVQGNIASVFHMKNNVDQTLKYGIYSYNLLTKIDEKGEPYAHALFFLAIAYGGKKQNGLAEEYYKQALSYSEKCGFLHLALYVRYNYMLLLNEMGQWDKAYQMALSNVEAAKTLDNKTLMASQFKELSKIASHKKNYKQALDWMSQSVELSESLAATEKDEGMSYIKNQFNTYKKEQEEFNAQQQEQLNKNKIENRTLWVLVLSMIGLMLGVVVIVLSRRIYIQCRVNNLIKSRLSQTLSVSQNQMSSLKEDFEKEMYLKNKELTSLSLYFVKIQSLMDSVLEKLQAIKIQSTAKPKERILVAEMESLLRQFTPDKNWAEFETYFQEVDKGFFQKLETLYPDLTPNEKRLCAMISLNLSSKEIGVLTSRTFRTVNMAKTRLKKKMNIQEEESLYDVISHF